MFGINVLNGYTRFELLVLSSEETLLHEEEKNNKAQKNTFNIMECVCETTEAEHCSKIYGANTIFK